MKVRGLMTPRRLSEDALAALESGDVDSLMAINRAEFGGFFMEKSDDDDEDDDDDDADASGGSGKKKKVKDDDGASDADADDDDEGDADKEALRRRMKAADRARAAAEAELQKIRDKDKTELERAQTALTDLEKNVENLQGEVSTLRLQNAFLTSNSHKWHDGDTALALAEKKGYLEDVVDDEGVVDKKALGKALDRLAKEHKYLVNSDKDTTDDDDEPDGPSGEPAGRRSDNSKDEKAKAAQLRRRFPVLSNR